MSFCPSSKQGFAAWQVLRPLKGWKVAEQEQLKGFMWGFLAVILWAHRTEGTQSYLEENGWRTFIQHLDIKQCGNDSRNFLAKSSITVESVFACMDLTWTLWSVSALSSGSHCAWGTEHSWRWGCTLLPTQAGRRASAMATPLWLGSCLCSA